MFKVKIKKNNIVTNEAVFASEQLADTWISQEVVNKSFGKPERWVSEDRIELEGEDIAKSIEMIIEPIMGQEVKLYKFAAEYQIEKVDATAEMLEIKKISDRAKKRAFGESLIDRISVINEGKGLSVEQADSFMSNPLIVSLREHLWAGNIDTFVSKLNSNDVSAFFSQAEKDAVILECNNFLNSLGG